MPASAGLASQHETSGCTVDFDIGRAVAASAGAQRGNDSMWEVGSQFIGVGKPAQFHQEVSRISQIFPCLKRMVNVYSVVW
jgi:hypothetical protein